MRKSGASALTVAGLPAFLAACGGEDKAATTSGASTTKTTAAKLSGSITVASWGGTYNDDLQKYFGEPFTKKTGVQVKFVANT
ncbi:MAG: hypothetical protein LT070_06520, partial [Solirubrobacteraceae bacterium]|nr:hypothetical protein [Solirubrobacteraceae bacterium]